MRKLALLIFCAFSAAASESFQLNIPLREDPSRETGLVRITLGLDSPPAGAQLVVNGTTTVNLGQTQTVGSDSVTFEAGAGNSVRILYRPLNNFPTPNNFCNSTGVPTEVQMRFSGAQDVVDYRISSYAVGAPGVECSQVFERVGDFPASITPLGDGVAPELNAVLKGRHPFDLVLVLDKSGSMAELPPEAEDGPSKADILKSALTAFVAQWSQIDAAAVDENGNPTGVDNLQDRIGIIFFDGAATPQTLAVADPPTNVFVQRGSGSAWDDVVDRILTLTPGTVTSIGAGINEGMRQWTLDPDNDLTVILVTDGKQNTAPLVTADPNGILSLTPVPPLVAELRKRFVPIQTIAFGLPTGVDLELLQRLSLQTNGNNFIAVDGVTMFNTLAQALVSILKGNTISLALSRTGALTDAGPTPPQRFAIDGTVRRIVVSLAWDPPRRDALEVDVFRPDGTLAVPSSVSQAPQSVVKRFDIGQNDSGMWNARVKRQQSAPTERVPYALHAMVEERQLEYRFTFDDTLYATGDRIRMTANIALEGRALNKLPSGAVRVRVQRPPEALGTILHNDRTPVGDGTTMTPTGDVQTPYDRKVARLSNASLVQRLLPRDVTTLTMQEERPGVYTATFDETNVPGAYGFEFVLDWDDPRTGAVHREERIEQQVKVRPDATMTEIVTTPRDGGVVLVSVTPRDRFGNYVGPGYAPVVKATLNGPGTISSVPVDPDQTGTYVFTVSDVPVGTTPDVTVVVDGTPVGGTTRTSPPAAGNWRVFLDLGPNYPHSIFAAGVDGKWSVNAGLERVLTPNWSLELILGHHTFDAIFNLKVQQLSLGAKRWFGSPRLRPFAGGSLGAYRFELGRETTKAGLGLSAGALYALSPRWGVEGVYTHHLVGEEEERTRFSSLQVGVRVSF